MVDLRKSLWAAALLALPAPAFAQQQDMCAALNRLAAAAREPVPFSSLETTRGEIVPGFGPGCRVRAAQGGNPRELVCMRPQFAPESLIAETVGATVRECLDAEALPGQPYSSQQRYGTRDLLITLSSHCDDRCHVGRSATLIVTRRETE